MFDISIEWTLGISDDSAGCGGRSGAVDRTWRMLELVGAGLLWDEYLEP